MSVNIQRTPHKQVDWSTEKDGRVQVTCPTCTKPRKMKVSYVRNVINNGVFTGICQACNKTSGNFNNRSLPAGVNFSRS